MEQKNLEHAKQHMNLKYHFKQTKKGWYVALCDLFEISIHKGIRGWGKTEESAMNNLNKRWNEKVKQTHASLPPNATAYQVFFKQV